MGSSKNGPSTRPKTTRIVVVDDHPMVREWLGELINHEPDLTVCGEAESHPQALEVIANTRPDLAIIDLSLKESHGLDLIKELRQSDPNLAMLVVSMYDEAAYAERVLRAGARGYITKQEVSRTILSAIRRVLAGELVVSGPSAQTVLHQLTVQPAGKLRTAIDELSDRELQVLELIGRGLGSRQIAAALSLDMKTIDCYRARLKEKLNLPDVDALRQYAIHWVHQR